MYKMLSDNQTIRVEYSRGLVEGILSLLVGLAVCGTLGAVAFFTVSWHTPPKALTIAMALGASCLIAGLWGISQTIYYEISVPFDYTRSQFIGLSAAVVGGTSPRGSRGGVVGPTFAALAIGFLSLWQIRASDNRWWFDAVLAFLLIIGLVIHGVLDNAAKRTNF